MNAPISDQIKAEAAKSLLERLAEKTRLVRFFRYNASAKHGVPIDDDNITIKIPDSEPTLDVEPIKQEEVKPEPPKPEPVVQKEQTETKVLQPVVVEKNSGDKMKGILQTLAAVAALAAAAWGGSQWASSDKDVPTTVIQQPYQESPFQYLEDIGEHLP